MASARLLMGEHDVAHTECAELRLGALPPRPFYFRYLRTGNVEADNYYVRLVLVGSDTEELPVVRFRVQGQDVNWSDLVFPTATFDATVIGAGTALDLTAQGVSFSVNKQLHDPRDWETILTARVFEP